MAEAPQTVAENIDHVISLEEELSAQRGIGGRIGDRIVEAAGRFRFVAWQLGIVVVWMAWNSGLLPGARPFDPFPFNLAGEILSLEGVLLAAFVLMKQRHESRLSERRSHLSLQANLLVERKVTKLMELVQGLHPTNPAATDGEVQELTGGETVQTLSEELDRRLARSGE